MKLFGQSLITTLALGCLSTASYAENDQQTSIATSYLADNAAIELSVEGSYATGIFDDAAAEIVAYDRRSAQLFVTNAADNALDVLSIRHSTTPKFKYQIDLSPYGAGPNSVAIKRGLIAVAVEADPKQDPGSVVFFNRAGKFLGSVEVGALPDMLTFTPDGQKILVANEGEPNDDYDNDPEGTVSIITLPAQRKDVGSSSVETANFNAYDGLDLSPVRIYGPGASVSQDLEPEYITVSSDSQTAWVTLQENNAVAVVDIPSASIAAVVPLGVKTFDGANQIDASNDDGLINIAAWSDVVGMYQPDAITSYTADGETYLVTANEGDSRDYDGYSEEARIKDYDEDFFVDQTAYPNIDEIGEDELLGRLKITTATGDTDGDNDIDVLHAYGARSFSIWNAAGQLVYDSGSDFERITAKAIPENFNSTNDENGSFDNRSDDKGPEAEGVVVGKVKERTYAFIGLERVGGVMVYDITSPVTPFFVQYINNRDFGGDAAAGTAGDLGPEGLAFIPARANPSSLSTVGGNQRSKRHNNRLQDSKNLTTT